MSKPKYNRETRSILRSCRDWAFQAYNSAKLNHGADKIREELEKVKQNADDALKSLEEY